MAVGLLTGLAALALIPSQIVWGRLVDSTGRVKPFLIIGFVGMGASLALVPYSGTVAVLITLASLKSVLLAATLPARQLLTLETERKEGWKKGLADMQFLTSFGETLGMGLGALTAGVFGFSQLFLLCGMLCLASAGALGFLAREPGIMIQRRLVAMERSMGTLVAMSDAAVLSGPSQKRIAYERVSRMLDGSNRYLALGIFSFSLAGSAFYSPLPAYFLEFFGSSSVFFVLFASSLVGSLCYVAVGRVGFGAGKSLVVSASTRVVALPLLLLTGFGASLGLLAAVVVLSLLEVVWSVFDINSMAAYLETAKVGRAGFYGAIVGLGGAAGGFAGGAVSGQFGFGPLFFLCSVLCGAALVSFSLHFRRAA